MKKLSWLLSFLIIGLAIISIINNREDDPNFLDDELIEIEKLFEKRAFKNTSVSEADVAWHLDHMLKTINRITENIAASNPKEYDSKFNIQRIVVHTTGKIPRGVAQSPQNVRPPSNILLDSLHLQLKEAKQNLEKISELNEKAFFAHPVFDDLDRDQTRRFLEIHTRHHLKIIKDILEE
jgi:hypothetical protein